MHGLRRPPQQVDTASDIPTGGTLSYENLLLDVKETIATLTINRPSALNALNAATLTELHSCLRNLATMSEVQVVILTGAGERAFVAGADIAFMQRLSPREARAFALQGQEVLQLVETMPKPVIGAINGFALGGGCELAMACDFRLASENARFGQPEINLGIMPGFGGTQRLARLIGKGRAAELLFTGDMLEADEAHRIGLINRVVPSADLLSACCEIAAKITAKGQVAMEFCKEALNNGLEMDLERACHFEADLFALCFSTADQQEGMTAFLEKRAARFQGK